MSGPRPSSGDDAGGWEALQESEPAFPRHEEALEDARKLQAAISAHDVVDGDADWSEVVIELPDAPQGRRSRIAFRRQLPLKSSKYLAALDLSKSPEELLATVSLAQVIRSSDASALLLACVAKSSLFNTTALDFLADSDSEERFQSVPNLRLREYFEIVDTLNAFAILVNSSAIGTSFVYTPSQTSAPLEPIRQTKASVPSPPQSDKRSPAEVLEGTLLGQLVLRRGSPSLQRALRSAEGFNLSVQAFLEHDDAEAYLCSTRAMNTALYLELCDVVNDYTSTILARGTAP